MSSPSWPASTFMIWTGPHGDWEAPRLKSRYWDLAKKGVTGVFLGGYDSREAEAIQEAGMDLHIWMWTTNRRDQFIREKHKDWFMVSRSGKSCYDQPPYVEYYRWVSPFAPGVSEFLQEEVEKLAALPGVKGVHLDYVRYPDVILPRALWETYGLDQTEELPDYDFDYSDHARKAFQEAHGRDPLKIEEPWRDQEWIHFRQAAITSLVRGLKEAAHRRGALISAAVFPSPSYARRICRQSWSDWGLDAFCPMVYHSFYNEEIPWIGDRVAEGIQATPSPIIAGLYLPAFASGKALAEGIKLAKHRGAKGISLFGDMPEDWWGSLER